MKGNDGGRSRRHLVRAAVLLLAVGCVAAILARHDPGDVAREMQRGDVLGMAPFALLGALVSLPVVTAGDWLVVRRCLGGSPYPALVRGVAGAATLNALGYVANMGGYGLWLARASGAPALRTAGVVVYLATSELTGVAMLGAAALVAGGAAVTDTARTTSLAAAAALVALKLAPGRAWLASHLSSGLAEPWRLVRGALAWAEIGVRVVQVGVWLVATWLAARAFGMAVPLAVMAAYLPVVMLVGALPANVAGVGAVQGAWLLIVPWARSAEQVLAFALLWPLMTSALIMLRGLPFLRGAVTQVAREETPT